MLKEHPWVAKSLYDAFSAAKTAWLKDLDAGKAVTASDKRYSGLRSLVGNDPLPYGIEANLKSIQALERTAFNQQLTPRRMAIDELFLDPAKF